MSAQHSAAPEFLAIGHVTVDLLTDGTPTLGGTALYAALAAARFGMRAAILTRGNFSRHGEDIQTRLGSFASEFEIIVQSASEPTIMTNLTVAGRRQQTIQSWAGEIDLNGLPPAWRSTPIIHLAPVAQEIDSRQVGRLSPGYLGATPQGWMRNWSSGNRSVRLGPLRLPSDALGRIDAMVLSSVEQSLAREAIEAVAARGIVAITRGPAGSQIIDRGRAIDVPAFPVRVADDTGAGDVFAAVLFVLRAHHEPTTTAARLAAAAAALRIEGRGPEAVPTRDAAERFVKRLAESSRAPRAR
jgi:sugar/nucleoside kinase (ribokinase family)